MKYSFVFGPSGSGKTTLTFREMALDSLKCPEKRFFIIVPEQYSMLMQKRLLTLHPRHASGNIEVMSFNRLAWQVFAELYVRNPEILDDTGKAMLLRKVASENAGKLRVFGGKLKRAGFTEHVKSMISEFYQYGVKPEDLKSAAEGNLRLPLRQKLADLSLLYEAFGREIENRALTTEQVLHVFAGVAHRSSVLRGAVFLFDAFTGFTPVQYRLIETLLPMAESLTFNVTVGSEVSPFRAPGEEDLFRMSAEMTAKITDLASKNGVPAAKPRFLTERPRFSGSPELSFLEQHFLRYDGASYRGTPEGIFIREAKDPAGEAEQTAAEILRLVKTEGYRYRDIAVITADMDGSGAELTHEFRRQGIPFYMDRNLNVTANPLPELLRAALNCVTDRYSSGAFLRFVKCSLVPGSLILKSQLENYAEAAGIRGYRRFSAPWSFLPASEKGTDLGELNAYKEEMLSLLEPLRLSFEGGTAEVGTVVRGLKKLMEETDAERKLSDLAARFEAASDAEHAREYARVWEETGRILTEMEELLGEERLNREEMTGILEAGLNEIRVGQIPAYADRVSVGDLERTRLGAIRALFLLGANDGLLPAMKKSGGVLTDREKTALKEAGITLSPTAREDLCTQRYYLYRMLTSPSERLYVSCASFDKAGKTLRPSGILQHILRLFPGLSVQNSAPAAAETETPLYSELQAERLLLKDLRSARDGEMIPELKDLLGNAGREEKRKKRALGMVEAVTFYYEDRVIGQAAALALYGEFLYGSVTRIEEFYGCPMRHFLKYGLRLQEAGEYAYTMRDVGVLSHRVMELVFRKAAETGHLPGEMSAEEQAAFILQCVDEAVRDDESGLYRDSARNRYLVRKLCGIVQRSVSVMERQRMKGDFRPYALEQSLSERDGGAVLLKRLSCGAFMRLGGKADRIDIAESGDSVAVKILDYKTGSVKWEPFRILSGSQLQLLLYLEAAAELFKLRFPGKRIVPAAVLYMKLDNPWLKRQKKAGDAKTEAELMKLFRPDGLVNTAPDIIRHFAAEPEDLGEVLPVKYKNGEVTGENAAGEQRFLQLMRCARRKAEDAGERIFAGEAGAVPLKEEQFSACTYCSFSEVCGFDSKCPGYRERISVKIPAEEVFRIIGEEEEQRDA